MTIDEAPFDMTIAEPPIVEIKEFDIKELIRLRDEWILKVSDKLPYKVIALNCGLSPHRIKQIVLRMRGNRATISNK